MIARLKIASIAEETDRIRRYVLVPAPGEAALAGFAAGAHIALRLGNGLVRQYSLSNPASDCPACYEIAVLREDAGRGGSAWIHAAWRQGDVVEMTQCANHFPLIETGHQYILLAAGIGITPILCMAHELNRLGKPFDLFYCTRTRADTAYANELSHSPFASRVRILHDGGDPSRGLDVIGLLKDHAEGTHVYFCGPGGFITAIRNAASHWPKGTVHYELFAADPEMELSNADDSAFEVVINSTGQIFRIPPDRTIVDVLGESGIRVETLCREGYCGSCLTGVISGKPDHRDTIQSDDEKATNDTMALCCSRARTGPLVLDL